jgi:hypothetical protein
MVTPLNNVNTTRTTGDVTQMVGSLAKRVDANRDGAVSTDEFARYLTSLLEAATESASPAPAGLASSPLPETRKPGAGHE